MYKREQEQDTDSPTLTLQYSVFSYKLNCINKQDTLFPCTQQKLPDKKVTNFTSDWNDGTLVGALVDAMAPGLCPEHEAMNPANAFQNASHAMKLGEDWLDVPQVRSQVVFWLGCCGVQFTQH